METLTGSPAKASEFQGLEWIADLIYFEGPLLTLFRGERGSDVLALWVDCDKRRNRWVSFSVHRARLVEYLNGETSLKELIVDQKEVLFFHTSSGAKKNDLKLVDIQDFPRSYLPEAGSYWRKELATEDALTLVQEKVKQYKIGLDGDNWYLEDLSKALGSYRQLYAFHYAIMNRTRSSVQAVAARALSKLAWKGGFSTVMWYNALNSVTPSMHRLRVKEIQYASPGHITLEALPSVAAAVAEALAKLSDAAVKEEIQDLYTDTYKFFREHDLTRMDARDLSDMTPAERRRLEGEGVFKGISNRLDSFLSSYDLSFAKKGLLAAGAEELGLLKAMLSYHRRLLALATYVEDGGLTIERP